MKVRKNQIFKLNKKCELCDSTATGLINCKFYCTKHFKQKKENKK